MGVFKLGKMTFGSLFKKPETVLYPIEQKPKPVGLKGHIAIEAESCILCGMCDRSCATNCITVDKQARTWAIDRFQCIQCGYCVTCCPKKCLHMDPDYAPASTQHTVDVVEVPAQDKPAKAEKADDNKPAATAAAAAEKPSETEQVPTNAKDRDEALLAAIALMEPEKAQRVRDALEARS